MLGNSPCKQPSPRQQQALDLLLLGFTNKEISARLGISERTVKYHVSKLLVLCEASNRAELIAKLLRQKGDGVSPNQSPGGPDPVLSEPIGGHGPTQAQAEDATTVRTWRRTRPPRKG